VPQTENELVPGSADCSPKTVLSMRQQTGAPRLGFLPDTGHRYEEKSSYRVATASGKGIAAANGEQQRQFPDPGLR